MFYFLGGKYGKYKENMDIEIQKKVAKLYKEEIEQISENITAIRKETNEYKKKIDELKNKK